MMPDQTPKEDWEEKFIEKFGYIKSKEGLPTAGAVIVFIRSSLAQERRRTWEKAAEAVPKNQMDKSSEFRVQPNPHDEWWCRGWNAARNSLLSAKEDDLKN